MADKELQPEAPREVEPILEEKDAVVVNGVKFLPIYLGHDKGKDLPIIVHLSQREEKFIKRFLETLSIPEAANEIGIPLKTARNYLKRKNVRAVLDQAAAKAAIRNGTDLDDTIVWLRKGRDGVIDPTDAQIKCGQTLAKVLKPAGAGTNIHIGDKIMNFDSPYKGMDSNELKETMRERLSAIQGGPTSTA